MQWRHAITIGAVIVAATTVTLEAQTAVNGTSDTASEASADWAATRAQMVQTVERDLQKLTPPATVARHTAPRHAKPPKAREVKIRILVVPHKAKA
jgi:type II secretory pathway component PulJ